MAPIGSKGEDGHRSRPSPYREPAPLNRAMFFMPGWGVNLGQHLADSSGVAGNPPGRRVSGDLPGALSACVAMRRLRLPFHRR